MVEYHKLLNDILLYGTQKEQARDNMPVTKSLFGYQFRHNLYNGFPLLTTKKMFIKGFIVELLWFLRGETNIKFLDERGVTKFWHEDSYNYYISKCKKLKEPYFDMLVDDPKSSTLRPFTFEEFCSYISRTPINELASAEIDGIFYTIGDCGYQYGKVWRDFNGVDQISTVLNSLKNNPFGRRHVVTAIAPEYANDLALYWCHAMFQFNCRPISIVERIGIYSSMNPNAKNNILDEENLELYLDEENVPKFFLDCQLYQRSADVFLGVPNNIASYALLTNIFAKLLNMVVGDYVHTFGDVHIYSNHMVVVDTQLQRQPYDLPTLKFSDEFMNKKSKLTGFSTSELNNFFSSLEHTDFIFENYKYHPIIEAKLSTGMK